MVLVALDHVVGCYRHHPDLPELDQGSFSERHVSAAAGVHWIPVVMIEGEFAALKQELLKDAPAEAAAFGAVTWAADANGLRRLILRDVRAVPAGGYADRSEVHASVRPEVVAGAIKAARTERSGVALVHTHPIAGSPGPSAIDIRGEAVLLPVVRFRCPGAPSVRLIITPDHHHVAVLTEDGELPGRLVLVGENMSTPNLDDAADLEERFDRQVRAFGRIGQAAVRRTRVGIIGLGGTGSHVAQQLSHLGIQDFLLIDPDDIEVTNLNRVVGASPEDVGKAKVLVAEGLIHRINPSAGVVALKGDITRHTVVSALRGVDFIFICTDSHGSRAVASRLAYQYLIPAIDMGAAIHPGGQMGRRTLGRVQYLAPGFPCLICVGSLDPEQVRRDLLEEAQRQADPYILTGGDPAPSVVALNGVVASLAVSMFLDIVAGTGGSARQLLVTLDSGHIRPVAATPQAACPVCSADGALAQGDGWPLPGRLDK